MQGSYRFSYNLPQAIMYLLCSVVIILPLLTCNPKKWGWEMIYSHGVNTLCPSTPQYVRLTQRFSPWWSLIGSYLEHEMYGYTKFGFRCLTDVWQDGQRRAVLPGTDCPLLDFGNNYLILTNQCMGYCFCNYPPPGIFRSKDLLFKQRIGHVIRISFVSDSYVKLKIISRSFPGLTTVFPCSVWCREWTNCFLYGGLHWGLWF